MMAGGWVCLASSRLSLTPEVQRGVAVAPGSAAFKTARQRLEHATSDAWYGVGATSRRYATGGARSEKYTLLAGGTKDGVGRNEQAVTPRFRRDGEPPGSVLTVTI